MDYIDYMPKVKSVQQRVWCETLRLVRKLCKMTKLSAPTVIHHAVEAEYLRESKARREQQ